MNETRLRRALAVLFPQFFPREPYLGPRRYRVVRMRPSASSAALTRLELQIVNKATNLPDLLLISPWPGIAGFTAELTPGALVLVQFIDGDPGAPILTHYSTPDDPAWKPVNATIDVSGKLTMGPSATEVDIAKGTDSIAAGTETKRAVCYGDFVMMPFGSTGTPTAVKLLAANLGDTGVPTSPVKVSKVRNQ